MPVTKKTPTAKSPSWTWPNKAKVALSVVVNVEEGSEYSLGDGDKITEPLDELGVSLKKPIRNYGNESNYRYGILEGHARVAALLDKYKVAATYTAAAVALERAPEIADYIKARKHETCCHGYRWVHQFSFDEVREREFIKNGLDSIEKSTGVRPQGWLSRYLHTENTRRLLQEAGCLYHMDDYSCDTPFWGDVGGSKKKMIILPYQLERLYKCNAILFFHQIVVEARFFNRLKHLLIDFFYLSMNCKKFSGDTSIVFGFIEWSVYVTVQYCNVTRFNLAHSDII
jgi:hypothetical protein